MKGARTWIQEFERGGERGFKGGVEKRSGGSRTKSRVASTVEEQEKE